MDSATVLVLGLMVIMIMLFIGIMYDSIKKEEL